ncbi:MAG: fumarylacetoacetate hydrolase family protein [Acidimicrobiia bacterium]
MKFARFDGRRTGLVVRTTEGDQVVDVAASAAELGSRTTEVVEAIGSDGRGSWVPLIERWDDLRASFAALAERGAASDPRIVRVVLDEVQLEAPMPCERPRIFAPAGNFATHIAMANTAAGEELKGANVTYGPTYEENVEIRRAEGPAGFWIEPDTVVGPEAVIAPPRGTETFDYEVEGAVILRKGGRYLEPGDLEIWGQAVWNDLSLRDWALELDVFDRGVLNWAFQKNFESGNAFGPWVCVDEGPDPYRVRLITRVNGEIRQDARTDDAIFDYDANARYISRFLTLKPGDILTSGTIHGTAIEAGRAGPFLRPGDVVEVEVEGVGVLRNHVGAWEQARQSAGAGSH